MGDAETMDQTMDGMNSPYYRNTSHAMASLFAMKARRKAYRLFIERIAPGWNEEILDVGMTCDTSRPESNFLEQWYQLPRRITGCGTEPGNHLEEHYGIKEFIQVTSGKSLPFSDKQFPIVFCNAVVEHVGSREQQQQFISELLRVGRRVFVTTPNRWHPMEFHTCLPLLHWLPKSAHRIFLRMFRMSYWSKESNLNLLTNTELKALFGRDGVEIEHIKLCGLTTNLAAIYL